MAEVECSCCGAYARGFDALDYAADRHAAMIDRARALAKEGE